MSPTIFVTGSVRAEIENSPWPGTGRLQRLVLLPMTVRELRRLPVAPSFVEKLITGVPLAAPAKPVVIEQVPAWTPN